MNGSHVSPSRGGGSRRGLERAPRGGDRLAVCRMQEAKTTVRRARVLGRARGSGPRGDLQAQSPSNSSQITADRRRSRVPAHPYLFRRALLWIIYRIMFQAVLKEVVDGTEGGIATLLMDFEGIALDSYSKPDAPFDITTIGVEFGVVLKSIQRAAQMLEAGETAEVAIQAEKVTTLIRILNDSYFLAFSMTPDANIGKARYLLRIKAPILLKELS